MSQPYVGEIRMFAGNFAPVGWAFCNGASLPLSNFDTLFNLIGTTYGGDGQQTFNLPNLQSRVPLHMGTSNIGGTYVIGQPGGTETVTLTVQQMPSHTHPLVAANTGQAPNPTNATIFGSATSGSQAGTLNVYGPPPFDRTLGSATIKNDGGSQPHSNIQPYVALNFIISLYGVYPSRP
jgi:microcystin-dependent protein